MRLVSAGQRGTDRTLPRNARCRTRCAAHEVALSSVAAARLNAETGTGRANAGHCRTRRVLGHVASFSWHDRTGNSERPDSMLAMTDSDRGVIARRSIVADGGRQRRQAPPVPRPGIPFRATGKPSPPQLKQAMRRVVESTAGEAGAGSGVCLRRPATAVLESVAERAYACGAEGGARLSERFPAARTLVLDV